MPLNKNEAARLKRVLNQLKKTVAPLHQANADLWPPSWHHLQDRLSPALTAVTGTIQEVEQELAEPDGQLDLEEAEPLSGGVKP